MFSRAAHPSPSSLSLQYLKVVVVVVFPIKTVLTLCRLEAELFLLGSLWSPERSRILPDSFQGEAEESVYPHHPFSTLAGELFSFLTPETCASLTWDPVIVVVSPVLEKRGKGAPGPT